MKTITVGELKRRLTQTLACVEEGESYRITLDDREIGRIVPPGGDVSLIPAKHRGRVVLPAGAVPDPTPFAVDELLGEMRAET